MFDSLVSLGVDPCGDTWWRVPDRVPPEDPVYPSDLTDPDSDNEVDGFGEVWAGAGGATGVERLSSEPGGVLAVAVEDAVLDGRVADLDDEAVVAAAVAAQRLLGWAMGAQLQTVAELGRRWERTPLGERAAVAELALACGVSEYTMSRRLDASILLPTRLPRVWAALAAGHLEWAKAWEILDKTTVLSDQHAAAVEDEALAVALTSNLPDLRAHLARAIAVIDPDGTTDRAKDAHARRAVTFRPGPDATATMALTASAATIAHAEAALNRLTLAAHHRDTTEPPEDPGQDSSAPRHPEVTRADVLLDLIHTADTDLTTPPDPPDHPAPSDPARRPRTRFARTRPEILVTVPLSTLLTLDETPADLASYGPIPAAMARELTTSLTTTASWRCAVTDDRPGHPHGTLLALGRSTTTSAYTPTTAARDFVTTRDHTCRFPGCRRRANPSTTNTIDLDHRVPWRADGTGGATCECNLQSLCQNHHRLKHEARFGATRDPTGTLTWTTPTGRTYRQALDAMPHAPLPVNDGQPDPDPDPDPPPF